MAQRGKPQERLGSLQHWALQEQSRDGRMQVLLRLLVRKTGIICIYLVEDECNAMDKNWIN